MTPTEEVLGRLAQALEMAGIKERPLLREVGIDEGALSATRSRGGDVGWSRLAPIVALLESKYGISSAWILWGKEPKIVARHLGERSITPPPIRRRKIGQ